MILFVIIFTVLSLVLMAIHCKNRPIVDKAHQG